MSDWVTRVHEAMPACDRWTARLVEEHGAYLSLSRGVVQPPHRSEEHGVMLTVGAEGGIGYAATADLSPTGLRRAALRARDWARSAARHRLFDPATVSWPQPQGHRPSPAVRGWDTVPLADKVAALQEAGGVFAGMDALVHWTADLWHADATITFATSEGAYCTQQTSFLRPALAAIADDGGDTLVRSWGRSGAVQAGMEWFDDADFGGRAGEIVADLRALIAAPVCPTDRMDLLLAPDQMMLQIHESIGHPLELDRILGDERNFAGTTFVTPDMIGHYQYGSTLLNVTFDPTDPSQLASYAYDDLGAPAEKTHLIRDGVLVRALGGTVSQARSGLPGVANSRASDWWRPPIDRMANLNVEPGDASFDELVGRIERGILMATSQSWSIDDSRDKFQFGVEFGRMIEDGIVGDVVRKPGYRGRSAAFWRSLVGVGDASTFRVFGTPFCGKGEPYQLIRVGHASPACLFADVDVFGGA